MKRFARYLAVGAVATAAHYLLLVLLVEGFAWPAWLAAGAGAVVGAQRAYLGNRGFTFGHHGGIVTSWWRFQLTAVVGALLAMLVVGTAQRFGVHYLFGQVVATLLATLLTYAINRRWTFGPTRDQA
jgi:putative flippase GtrA